jgi:hypothetical protein
MNTNNSQSSPFRDFSLGNYNNSSASTEFLESNSIVAKLAFLMLVVFAFFILLRMFTGIMSYIINGKPTGPTKLIDGMKNATEQRVFNQNPSNKSNKTIYRSENQDKGIVTPTTSRPGNLYHVFHKGNNNIDSTGLNTPNNAPGLYINSSTNSLQINMDTYNSNSDQIIVPNIPRNKWINVIIRCKNTTVDVYINGLIAQSYQLSGVPKQNYGNVYVSLNGGFPGFISNLFYYKHALSISEIQELNQLGPNLTLTQNGGKYEIISDDYLSLRWYFNA